MSKTTPLAKGTNTVFLPCGKKVLSFLFENLDLYIRIREKRNFAKSGCPNNSVYTILQLWLRIIKYFMTKVHFGT